MAVFTLIATIGAAITINSAWFIALAAQSAIYAGIVQVGLGLAVGLIAKLEFGKPSSPQSRAFGVNGVLQRGGVQPQSFIFGNYPTSGSLVFAEEWGWGVDETNNYLTNSSNLDALYNSYSKRDSVTRAQFGAGLGGAWQRANQSNGIPNQYLTQIIQLSDLPVRGLEGLIIDGEKVTVETTSPHEVFGQRITNNELNTKNFDGFAWVKFYDGTQTEADAFLTITFGDNQNYPIDSNCIGTGNAYAIVTTKIRKEEPALWNGFPNMLFVINGIELLSAGSGQKALVHDNPVDMIYTIMMGLEFNNKWVWGGQVISPHQIRNSEWLIEANKAASAGYTCGGEIQTGDDPIAVIDELLLCCNGKISETAGLIRILAVEPNASVASFVDDDIITTDSQTFVPFKDVSSAINGVSMNYISPDDNWETITAPPLYNEIYEAEDDGRRLIAKLESAFITNDTQAQRIMKASLMENRRERRHAISLPAAWWQIEPLDIITWSSDTNGYTNKKFLVVSISDSTPGDVVLDITEIDDADVVWNSQTDFTEITRTPTVSPNFAAQTVRGWSVSTEFLYDINGKTTDLGIRLNWDPIDVDHILYQIRAKDVGNVLITEAKHYDTTTGTRLIIKNWRLETEYEVRAKFGLKPSRAATWTDWTTVLGLPSEEPNVEISDYLKEQGETYITSMKVKVSAESRFYDRAQIRYRRVEKNQVFSVVAAGKLGDFDIPVVEAGDRYEIEVSLVSTTGEVAKAFVFFYNVVGKFKRPRPVENFLVNATGSNAILSWNPSTELDISHYVIKHSSKTRGANYSNAQTLVEIVPRGATSVAVVALHGTYFIRSFDKQDLSSEAATSTILDRGGELERGFNTVETVSAHPNFAGTLTRAKKVTKNEIVGLQLDDTYFSFKYKQGLFAATRKKRFLDQLGPWWTGWYDFGVTDLGSSFFCELRPNIVSVYQNLADNLTIDTVPGNVDSWTGTWDSQTNYTGGIPSLSDATDFELLVSTTNDSPEAGNAIWSPYGSTLNRKVKCRGLKFRALLRSRYNYASPRITELSCVIDMPDRIQRGQDIAVTGNKTITFSSGFYRLPTIGITAQNLSNGERYQIYDKSKTGFKIKILNSTNSEITATRTIDWTASGYGEQ